MMHGVAVRLGKANLCAPWSFKPGPVVGMILAGAEPIHSL